ncbi:MAG: SiaB family protein kinase [Bacteroidales bacterium]|nr:SiaB family protein kinase [Bacteroidales bacterium]
MNSNILYEFFNYFSEDNLTFIYKGNFSDEITGRLIDLSERNINSISELSRITNKISFLLAECFQNIVRHGETEFFEDRDYPEGMFITRSVGSKVYIISSNLIENTQIKEIQGQIETINNMDKDQLKDLHLRVLSDNRRTKKGGAGLGLIEMARKSGHKLEYEFEDFDGYYSFFYLQVKLDVNPNSVPSADPDFNITIAKQIYDKMREGNILIVCKGDFQQASIIPILKMIENNIQQQFRNFVIKKRTYHMLVEILQNIGKHSLQINGRREGIFLMSVEKDYYAMNAANYIRKDEIENLRDHINRINTFTKEELTNMYRKILISGKASSDGSAGLGLIDVAKESRDKLTYYFTPIDEEKSFFSLGATLNI